MHAEVVVVVVGVIQKYTMRAERRTQIHTGTPNTYRQRIATNANPPLFTNLPLEPRNSLLFQAFGTRSRRSRLLSAQQIGSRIRDPKVGWVDIWMDGLDAGNIAVR